MAEPSVTIHPSAIDASTPVALRGDPITGDRYYSTEFAQREWDHLWTPSGTWRAANRS